MTDFQVEVEISSPALLAMLQRLEAFGEDQRVVMDDLAEGLLNRTQDRFDTQTSPDGDTWAELTGAYKARKLRKGYPETLLVMEGRLRNELRPESGRDFAAVMTAALPYAAIHQFGGKAGMATGPAAIPARPYMGASPDDMAWIERTVAEHIERLAAGG